MGDHWEGLHLGLKLASSAWEKKPDMGKAMPSTQRMKPEKRKIRIKKKKRMVPFVDLSHLTLLVNIHSTFRENTDNCTNITPARGHF